MVNFLASPVIIRKQKTQWWPAGEYKDNNGNTYVMNNPSLKIVIFQYKNTTFQCIFEKPGLCYNYQDFEQYIPMEEYGDEATNLINPYNGKTQNARLADRKQRLHDRQEKRRQTEKKLEEIFGKVETRKHNEDGTYTVIRGGDE